MRGCNLKKILITGAGSFVGTYVQKYLDSFADKYHVTTVGTKNGEWQQLDFSQFDVIYHVAGLAHSDVGKVSDEMKKKYYAINCDLAISVAQKAKTEGVKQFIFMSSAIVYGDSAPIGIDKIITKKTKCSPANFYGDSKVQAEKGLLCLQSKSFRVVILRCPMVYGKGGKGNFPILERVARKVILFPKIGNKRSILYVGNLAEFVRLMIENEENGIFWPCNKEYANTSELVMMIAGCYGKKVYLISGFEWFLHLIGYFTDYANKAFGNFTYDEHIGDYKFDYRLYSLADSIKEIER